MTTQMIYITVAKHVEEVVLVEDKDLLAAARWIRSEFAICALARSVCSRGNAWPLSFVAPTTRRSIRRIEGQVLDQPHPPWIG